jgi:hypothetical protein
MVSCGRPYGRECRKGDLPHPSRRRRRIVGCGVYRQEGEGSGEDSGVYSGCQRKLMLDAELRRHPSAAMGNISSLHDLKAPLDP